MELTNFKWDQDGEGIVTLTWDMPGKPVNLLSMSAVEDLAKAAEAAKTDATIKGVVITSAKKGNFCAGADLEEMAAFAGNPGLDSAKAAFDVMTNVHRVFRLLETCGKPVAAAINGTAAAVLKPRWPVIIAWRRTTSAPSSAFPRGKSD